MSHDDFLSLSHFPEGDGGIWTPAHVATYLALKGLTIEPMSCWNPWIYKNMVSIKVSHEICNNFFLNW